MASLLDKLKNAGKSAISGISRGFRDLYDEQSAKDSGFQSMTSSRGMVGTPLPPPPAPSNKAMVFESTPEALAPSIARQKEAEAIVKQRSQIIPQPVKQLAKAVAPKSYEALATLRSPQTSGMDKVTAAIELPARLPQEVIAQPVANLGRGFTDLVRYGGRAADVPEYTAKSWLARQAFGEAPQPSLYARTVGVGNQAMELAKRLPQVENLPDQSLAKRTIPFAAGLLTAGSLGALEGTAADVGIGGAGSKAAKTALEKGAKEVVEQGAEGALGRFVKNAAMVSGKGVKEPTIAGKSLTYIARRIDAEDKKIMESFIDNVRLRKPEDIALETNARYALEGMGFSPDLSRAKAVNIFQGVLEEADKLKKASNSTLATSKKKVGSATAGRGVPMVGTTLYRGDLGKITETPAKFNNVLQVKGDQRTLLTKLAQNGDTEAAKILQDAKSVLPNSLDEFIDKRLSDGGYDAVAYQGSFGKDTWQEIRDVKNKKSYTDNRDLATVYSMGRSPKRAAESAFGGLAGLEPEYDEDGKIKGFKYNPALGAVGFAGVAVGRSKMGKEALQMLKQAKNDYIEKFITSSADGVKVAEEHALKKQVRDTALAQVSQFVEPEALVQAVKNTAHFRKEKSIADWMGDARILSNGKTFKLATGNEARALAANGYSTIGYVDEIVGALAPNEPAQKWLDSFVKMYDSKIPNTPQGYVDQYLRQADPNYAQLAETVDQAALEELPAGERYVAEGVQPNDLNEGLAPAKVLDTASPVELVPPPTSGKNLRLALPENNFGHDVVDEKGAQEYAKYMTNLREKARGKEPSRFTGIMGELKRKLVDSFAPIEDTLTAVEKAGQFKVLPKDDVRLQLDNVLRAPALAQSFIKRNGLEAVVEQLGAKDLDMFDQYLTARHAIDLHGLGIETGRDIARDKQFVEVMRPKFEKLATEVSGYSQKLLDYSVESGLISPDLAAQLKQKYPNYVPMQRVFDVLETVERNAPTSKQAANLNKQTIVQKIVGSERQIESPLGSIINKTNDALIEGERNKAARMLTSYSRLPNFPMKELQAGEASPYTVSFLDNGVKRTFATTKEIADAAKSMNIQQIGTIGNILNVPVRVFKAGTTGINPSFVLANLGKDQVTALLNTGFTKGGLDPRMFFQGLFQSVAHGELYDELVREGGLSTSFDVARNQTRQTLERMRANKNIKTRIAYTIRHPGELLRGIEDVFGRAEELTRIQQYKAAKDSLLKAGRTLEDAKKLAAQAARDNTANFARRGEWGRTIGALFPYANAGIQGTRSSLRAAERNPALYALKVSTLVFTPVAAVTAWNMRDPKRQEIYNDIADFEKENNLILVPPNATKDEQGQWNVWKIPLPPGVSSLANPVRLGMEKVYGSRNLKLSDAVDAALGFVSPINISVANDKGFSGAEAARTAASSLVPKFIQPPLENYTNKRFFAGTPVVPASLSRLSPKLQTRPNTSGILQKAGEAMNVSPLQLENLVSGYLGGAGAVGLHYADKAAAAAGVIPPEQVSGRGVVEDVTRRYQKARGGKLLEQDYAIKNAEDTAQADENYLAKQKAESLFKTLGKLTPEDRAKTVADLAKNEPKVLEYFKEVVKDAAAGLNERERLVKSMSIKDGQRADFIVTRYLPSLPAKERNKAMQDLVAKGVVTREILLQIIKKVGNEALQKQLENLPQAPTSTKPTSRAPVGRSLVVAKRNPSKVIAGYDFTTYATDPKWGNGVRSVLTKMPSFKNAEDITAYIQRHAPKSPLTGDMVIASAAKYNVPPQLILAIAKQEANFGTLGRAARTHNIGNVGNVDSGANVDWKSWQAGADALARNIAQRRIAA